MKTVDFGKSTISDKSSCYIVATAFDFNSVDFLEKIGIIGYKIVSGKVLKTKLLFFFDKVSKKM